MAVLFCDTDSELSFDTIEELGLQVIYMPYVFKGVEAYPQKDTDMPAFFNAMREGEIPTTAALNVQNYLDYFTPYFEKGEDILYVSFGTPYSQTFNAMNIAVKQLKEQYPNVRFEWFDTKTISMASGLLVYAAGLMYKQGASIDEIVAKLTELEPYANCTIAVESLTYLKRGGRVSSFAATMGALLNIKPILKMPEYGVLENVEKTRGRKQSIQYLIDDLQSNYSNLKEYPIVLQHANAPEECAYMREKITALFPDATIWTYEIGPVIGAHCGPGTLAISYFGSKRPQAKK